MAAAAPDTRDEQCRDRDPLDAREHLFRQDAHLVGIGRARRRNREAVLPATGMAQGSTLVCVKLAPGQHGEERCLAIIDAKTAATTGLMSALGLGLALRRVQRELAPKQVPLLGLAAAFLFVAQMINFPVLGGVSGHLMGGVLVGALLGASAGIVAKRARWGR